MTFFNSFAVVLFSFYIVGCSSSDSATDILEDPQGLPEVLEGSWFICEFSNPANCRIFDDDGIYLSANGEVLVIEESSQGSLEQCNNSPCFDSSIANIEVVRNQPIGTYYYQRSSGTVTLNVDGCNEEAVVNMQGGVATLTVSICDDVFDDSNQSDGSILQIYEGQVTIVSN